MNQTGRQYSIAKCIEIYGSDKLRKLPIAEQKKLVSEHYPRTQIKAYYKLWLLDFISGVNVKHSLTINQIDFIAERFSERSWNHLDLMLFFRNIKSGIYGQFFESLGPEKILDWAEIYWSDRASVAEIISESENKPFNPNTDKMDPRVFKTMFKDVEDPKEQEPKVIQKKHDTFLDSEKGFRAYLKNACITASNEQLIRIIESWRKVDSQIQYVDIFLEQLNKMYADKKEYHDLVVDFIKLRSDLSNNRSGSIISKIEHLEERINEFIVKWKI